MNFAIPIPADEEQRLGQLSSFGILDTLPERVYDDITLLASRICGTPIAVITLIDRDRQWFKSKVGIDGTETPREHAFCAHAIARPNEMLTVRDARRDARFADNPFVTGGPKVRFYAGAPLVTATGHALGTLCVIDREPREITPDQAEALQALARQVMVILEERRTAAALNSVVLAHQRAIDELRRSDTLFQEAYENAPIGIALVSIDGEWLRVNRPLCEILGYTAEELTSTSFQAITHPEDLEADWQRTRQMLAGEIGSYQMEKRYFHKSGRIVWVQLNVSLVWEGQQPDYFISQIQDISVRKDAERAKSQFLAMVSHELRTPVTALRGALALLASGAAGQLTDKSSSLVALAERNAGRLHRLVNDILDLEKIDTGAFQYRMTNIDMNQLVTQAVEELRAFASQYDVDILVQHSPAPALVRADPDRLMQVLANLISNAVKFSPANDGVEILVEGYRHSVRVSVTDHGAGIPEEFRPHVFKRFAQAQATATNRKGGSGLGLNISQAIVEHHGGQLAFRTALGAGTTFYFDLPVADERAD